MLGSAFLDKEKLFRSQIKMSILAMRPKLLSNFPSGKPDIQCIQKKQPNVLFFFFTVLEMSVWYVL